MAAPLATVTAYANSGFSMNDTPLNVSVLEANSNAQQLEVINCLPVSGKTTVTITVKPFNLLPRTDYLKIVGSDGVAWFGIVLGYEYVSMTSVQITAQLDGWLTCQAAGITSISGYTTRHTTADDEFGKYTQDDPLIIPSKPLHIISTSTTFGGGGQFGSTKKLVESTIDLSAMGEDTYNTSRTFDSDGEVVVPLAVPSDATTVTLSGFNGESASQTIGGRGIYDADNEKVKKGIAVARSLGYENGILGSYIIPTFALASDPTPSADGFYSTISGKNTSASPAGSSNLYLRFEYANVKNKRLLYGKTSQYILWSPASGDQLRVNPEDIYTSGGVVPTLNYMADPRSKGKPYFSFAEGPSVTQGGLNQCISGAQWDNLPLNYQNSSGLQTKARIFSAQEELAVSQYNLGVNANILPQAANLANAAANVGMAGATTPVGMNPMNPSVAGGLLTGPSNFVNGLVHMPANRDNFMAARKLEQAQFLASHYSAPQIVSPPDGEFIRDVYGNGCVLARYMLTEYDLTRLDRVLNMYGYMDNKALELSDLSVGVYATYVQANDVTIVSGAPKFAEQIAEEQLNAGIRLWKTKPSSAAYNNPNR